MINGANTGKISVGPVYGINSVGSFGGPFSPASFTYSVANFGTSSFNYTFSAAPLGASPWLSAVPSSGTITPGGSLTVVVSVNANATNLTAAVHTVNVIFNPCGIARLASIQVNAFVLTPTTNFAAAGPAGGPFVPASQVYVLSNATGSALNWTMNTAEPWSSLSATAGSLAGGSTTNINYSFNGAANALSVGLYADTISLTNATGNSLVTTIGVNLQVGFGIFDDFSTFTQNADLVGQNGWVAADSGGVTPIRSPAAC